MIDVQYLEYGGGLHMLTCTFAGSNQYDLDLNEKIQAAVETVVSKGNEIEFLFFRRADRFHHLCFLAVLKAKHQFQYKKITMTLVVKQGEGIEEDALSIIEGRQFPKWAFDRITATRLVPKDEKSSANYWRKIEREMVLQSDFVIACCYPGLRGSEYSLFTYAMKQRKTLVLNLVNDDTADFIKQAVAELPPNEQIIVEQINEGRTYTSLAKAAGISSVAIREKDSRGRKRLREWAIERLRQERIKEGPMLPKVCSVIIPGGPTGETDEVQKRFHKITEFFTRSVGVDTYIIEQSNCPSKCMRQLFWQREKLELIVITHYPKNAGPSLSDLQERYIPPFTKVINIDTKVRRIWARYLRGIKAVLERSDFVICSISGASSWDDRIGQYIKKQKGITVIDLGKSPCVTDPPQPDE